MMSEDFIEIIFLGYYCTVNYGFGLFRNVR